MFVKAITRSATDDEDYFFVRKEDVSVIDVEELTVTITMKNHTTRYLRFTNRGKMLEFINSFLF